jgi:hypothetical protein
MVRSLLPLSRLLKTELTSLVLTNALFPCERFEISVALDQVALASRLDVSLKRPHLSAVGF